eukprot:4404483-Pleurochrysis_carterae.AAC.1
MRRGRWRERERGRERENFKPNNISLAGSGTHIQKRVGGRGGGVPLADFLALRHWPVALAHELVARFCVGQALPQYLLALGDRHLVLPH